MPDVAATVANLPWLRPQLTPAEAYARGAQIGAAIGETQARLAQQAALAFLEQAERQRELEARIMMQREQIASHQQELQQRLAAQQLADQVEAEQAARQFAAGLAIERDIAAGVPPEQAILRHATFMMRQPAALAALARAVRQPPVPEPVVRQLGEGLPPAVQLGTRLYWPPTTREEGAVPGVEVVKHPETGEQIGVRIGTGPGRYHFQRTTPLPVTVDALTRLRAQHLYRQLDTLEKELRDTEAMLRALKPGSRAHEQFSAHVTDLRRQIDKVNSEIERIQRQYMQAVPGVGTLPAEPGPPEPAVPPEQSPQPSEPSRVIERERDIEEPVPRGTEPGVTVHEGPRPYVRLRHKSTGRVYRYYGDPSTVPTDEYEFLD